MDPVRLDGKRQVHVVVQDKERAGIPAGRG
jgi:hypothetical protein